MAAERSGSFRLAGLEPKLESGFLHVFFPLPHFQFLSMNTELPENETATSENSAAEANSSGKGTIAIGSQRDVADTRLAPQKPAAVAKAESAPLSFKPAQEIKAPVARPEVRSTMGLSDDIDAEIEAAISGMSMDTLVSEATGTEELEEGSRIKGVVARVEGENVFVTLKGRYQGVIPSRQFKQVPAAGDEIEVVTKKLSEEDGLYDLSLPGASVDSGDWESLKQGDLVECRVSGSNTGGLEVIVNQLRGFIPASQIERFRVEQFGDFVNQKLQCLVTEINPQKKRLVLSRRAVLDREFEEKRKELLASIEVGQSYEGTVTRLADFGAFVDIGGVEGLVHISKLSWSRVKHPKEVVQVGQKVKVKVEQASAESGKISLSYRDTLEHPWKNVDQLFPNGSVVKGVVSRLADFGAFVKVAPGVEGLVHISELAHHRVYSVKNHVQEGEEVEVKVLSVDPAAQKMSLSLKATLPAPEKKVDKKEKEVIETTRPLAVPKSNQPLRGGTSRRNDGGSFGLNL